MSKIPGLKLGSIGTGGGWGLGDAFARLPPASEQLEQRDASIFTVAPTAQPAYHSSDEEASANASRADSVDGKGHRAQEHPSARPPIHTTTFDNSEEDDDDTFVDHGSGTGDERKQNAVEANRGKERKESGGVVSSNSFAAEPVVIAPHQQKRLPKLDLVGHKKGTQQQHAAGDRLSGSLEERQQASDEDNDMYWRAGEVVSNMILPDTIHGMVMEGKNLWCAIGDLSLACLELAGGDLFTQRCLESVKRIRSLVLVQPPAPAQGKGFRSKRSGSTPHVPNTTTSAGTAPAASDSATLWCGHQNGSITIVNTFFCNEEMVIPNAHSDPIVHLYACGGRVWSVGADDTVRVWDASTRRSARRFTCAISDLCLVPTTNQVWTTPLDATFRVWNLIGTQSSLQGQGPSPGNNTYTMRSPIRCIKYHTGTNTIWMCLTKEMVILNPKNMKQLASVRLSVISLNFTGEFAVAVGHGGISERRHEESIVILKIVSRGEFKVETSLVAVGSVVDNVNVVGIRFFEHAEMGVIPCTNVNKERALSVFAVKEMIASGNWGLGPSTFDKNNANIGNNIEEDEEEDNETFRIVGTPGVSGGGEGGRRGPERRGMLAANSDGEENDDTFRQAGVDVEENEVLRAFSDNAALDGTLPPNSKIGGGGGGGNRGRSTSAASGNGGGGGLVAAPELLSKVDALEYELREARRDLRALKSTKSVQEDFSTLYARMLSISFKMGLQHPATGSSSLSYESKLSPEEIGTVEEGLFSSEGKLMGSVLASLEKTANLAENTSENEEEYGGRDAAAQGNSRNVVDDSSVAAGARAGEQQHGGSSITNHQARQSTRRRSQNQSEEQCSMASLHRMLRDVSRISRDERTMQNQQVVSLQAQVRELQNRLMLFTNAHAALSSTIRIAVEEIPDFGVSVGQHTPHGLAKAAAVEHADNLRSRGQILGGASDLADMESYLEDIQGATHEAFKAYRLQQVHMVSLPQQQHTAAAESPREGAVSTNFESISETSLSNHPNSSRMAKPQSARNARSPRVSTSGGSALSGHPVSMNSSGSILQSPTPAVTAKNTMMSITSLAALPNRIRLAFFWEKLNPEIESLSNDVSAMVSKASSVDMIRVEVVRGQRQAESVDRSDFFSGILHADICVAGLLFRVCSAESRAVVLHAVLSELSPLLIEEHQRQQEEKEDDGAAGNTNAGSTRNNNGNNNHHRNAKYERMGSDNSTIENEVELSAKKLNRIVADLEKSSEKVRNLMSKHFTELQLVTADGTGLSAIPLPHCRVWLGRLYGKLQWQHVWVRLCAESFAELEAIIRVPMVTNDQRSLLYTYCTDSLNWLETSEAELSELRNALSSSSSFSSFAGQHQQQQSAGASNVGLFSSGSLYTFYFHQSARSPNMVPSLFLTSPLSLGTVEATENFSPERGTGGGGATGSGAGGTPASGTSQTPVGLGETPPYRQTPASQYVGMSPPSDLGTTLQHIVESIETLKMKCDKLHAAGLEIRESVLSEPTSSSGLAGPPLSGSNNNNDESTPILPTTPPVSSRGKPSGKMTKYLREFCSKLPITA